MSKFTITKFSSLTQEQKHKHAARLLKDAYLHTANFQEYSTICKWLEIPTISPSFEQVADRYHFHVEKAQLRIREHEFLSKINRKDTPSNHPFLDITVYLDNLRLAQNVGSIIRTTESLRFGGIFFGGTTPYIDQKKVKDASMGTFCIVDCHKDPQKIKRPILALETVEEAKSLYDYPFPESFTLMVGNEEYGVSKKNLPLVDDFIKIPLQGQKNSINVACAFAAAASFIRNKHFFKS